MGGSVWEFKIDPKRLREEIKNDIEKQINHLLILSPFDANSASSSAAPGARSAALAALGARSAA